MIRRHATLSELKCSSVLQVAQRLPYVVRCRVSRQAAEQAVDTILQDGSVAYISARLVWSPSEPECPIGRDCFEVLFGGPEAAIAFALAVDGVLTPHPFDGQEISAEEYLRACTMAGADLTVGAALEMLEEAAAVGSPSLR